MKSIAKIKAEHVKKAMNEAAGSAKKGLREKIHSNKKHIEEALDINAQLATATKDKLERHKIEDPLADSLAKKFNESIDLAEDTLDSLTRSVSTQMEMNLGFNTKLVESINYTKSGSPENLLDLIQEHFEALHQSSLNNVQAILELYNKHTDLAVNFNLQFEKEFAAKIDSLFQRHPTGLIDISEWAAEWWKRADKQQNF